MIGKYLPLLAASLRRKRLRTFFTVASIVVAFLLFGLAESLRYSLQSGVDVAGADRLLTMHKVSFTQLLPQSYENRIRAVDGVADVTPQTWFGAWYQDERNQIPTFPVKPALRRPSGGPSKSSRPDNRSGSDQETMTMKM